MLKLLDNIMTKLQDGMYVVQDICNFLRVSSWPKKYRRLFILTFPISFPLWCLCYVPLVVYFLMFISVTIFMLAVYSITVTLSRLWGEG